MRLDDLYLVDIIEAREAIARMPGTASEAEFCADETLAAADEQKRAGACQRQRAASYELPGSGMRRSIQIFRANTLSAPSVVARPKWPLRRGSHRWYGSRLHEVTRSRSLRDGESGPAASRRDMQALTDDAPSRETLLSQNAVGVQNKGNGFLQVRPGFIERCALGVGAR